MLCQEQISAQGSWSGRAAPAVLATPLATYRVGLRHEPTFTRRAHRTVASRLQWPLLDKDDARDCLAALHVEQPGEGHVRLSTLNKLSYDIMLRYAATQLELGMCAVVDCPLARVELFFAAQGMAAKVKPHASGQCSPCGNAPRPPPTHAAFSALGCSPSPGPLLWLQDTQRHGVVVVLTSPCLHCQGKWDGGTTVRWGPGEPTRPNELGGPAGEYLRMAQVQGCLWLPDSAWARPRAPRCLFLSLMHTGQAGPVQTCLDKGHGVCKWLHLIAWATRQYLGFSACVASWLWS
jgi:hypothetical protein